jgi:hypothetical protein
MMWRFARFERKMLLSGSENPAHEETWRWFIITDRIAGTTWP